VKSNNLSTEEVVTRGNSSGDSDGEVTTVVLYSSINTLLLFLKDMKTYVEDFGSPVVGVIRWHTYLSDLEP
jgi:hypothetical protein